MPRWIKAPRAGALGGERLRYTIERIAPGVSAAFAVDPASEDPINQWILTHGYPHEPPNQLFTQLARTSTHVVDVGAHIGTFALAAAAAGCNVLAVEGSPDNVALLRAAKEQNGFTRLQILHAAAGDHRGVVQFAPHQAWGQVAEGNANPELKDYRAIEVPMVTIGDTLDTLGWPHVDLVKIDVEGAELSVLQGMQAALRRDHALHLVIEINELQLAAFGITGGLVKQFLVDLGYQLFLIDRAVPGDLVPLRPGAPQFEAVADIYAVRTVHQERLGPWRVREPFSPDEAVSRFREAASSPYAPYRRYVAQALAAAIQWEEWDGHAGLHELLKALELDDEKGVPVHAQTALAADPVDS